MKSAEPKIASANTHIQRKVNLPFFSKTGQGSYFSKTNEVSQSFFNPNIIQAKCSPCEEEEKLQKKEEDQFEENQLKLQPKMMASSGGTIPHVQLQTEEEEEEEPDRFDLLHPSRNPEELLQTVNPSIMENMQTYCTQNCPATAAALYTYLQTGDITTAHCSPMMERQRGFGYSVPAATASFTRWTGGRRSAWRFIQSHTIEHGRFVVVEGDRVRPPAGLTRYHYFIILNIRGDRFVVDAYTHQVTADITGYIRNLGTQSYSVYTGTFTARPIVQPKLTMGQPNDKYEVEADSMADKVVQKLSKNQNQSASEKTGKNFVLKKGNSFNSGISPIQLKSKKFNDKANEDLQNQLNSNSGGGNQLSPTIQNSMGSAFGADFSNVRIHTNSTAVQMNKELNAQAFTHGNDIYFNQGKYDVNSTSGKHLLAHELTHTIQQLPKKTLKPQLVQRQQALDDPGRADALHRNLFDNSPSGTRQPWVEPTSSNQIFQEFKTNFPPTPPVSIPVRTTESQAETDALVADQRIRTTFSEITNPVSESRLRDALQIMDDSFFSDEEFRRAWLANEMIKFTAIETFEIDETDVRFKALQDRLFSDGDVGDDIENKMRTISAFARGDDPSNREIFLNQGISPEQRRLTLIHEIVHFYAHTQYKEWMDQSTASRFYNEGLTEHFAREVMTRTELTNRRSYQDRVDAVERDILAFASESDVRKAFFQGEVWRLEHTSDKAREAFGNQIGLQPDATRDEEQAQSITSQGIVQTVEDNRHFRFMNIGISQADPKPAHSAFLQTLFTNVILQNPSLRLRFVGHTSSTGSISFNRDLSRRRVNAFYQLARDAGIAENQIINPDNPEFEGELSGTADNDTVIGRAMNRRVELFIVPPNSTELEDNVFHLERLRGQGKQDDGITLEHDLNQVFKNSPNPEALLPYTSTGWNSNEIMTQLGQHDILGGTDSDNLRCVQAVAMASYIPGGPDAVVHYLEIIVQEAHLTRSMNQRRLKAIEVINFIKAKITSRTAIFGDLSWAQEAVHDLFFDDVSGTDLREIINQISPSLDTSRTSQSLDVWTNSSSELMAAIQGIQPGEQFIVNHWTVLFDQTFEELRGQGEPTHSPMQVNLNGRLVTISELNPTSRPDPTLIDENRDKKSGHQLLVFMDATRRIWFFEPEIQESGRHLFEVTNNPSLFDPYFTELADIETYEYVQILGKITPVVVPTGTP